MTAAAGGHAEELARLQNERAALLAGAPRMLTPVTAGLMAIGTYRFVRSVTVVCSPRTRREVRTVLLAAMAVRAVDGAPKLVEDRTNDAESAVARHDRAAARVPVPARTCLLRAVGLAASVLGEHELRGPRVAAVHALLYVGALVAARACVPPPSRDVAVAADRLRAILDREEQLRVTATVL